MPESDNRIIDNKIPDRKVPEKPKMSPIKKVLSVLGIITVGAGAIYGGKKYIDSLDPEINDTKTPTPLVVPPITETQTIEPTETNTPEPEIHTNPWPDFTDEMATILDDKVIVRENDQGIWEIRMPFLGVETAPMYTFDGNTWVENTDWSYFAKISFFARMIGQISLSEEEIASINTFENKGVTPLELDLYNNSDNTMVINSAYVLNAFNKTFMFNGFPVNVDIEVFGVDDEHRFCGITKIEGFGESWTSTTLNSEGYEEPYSIHEGRTYTRIVYISSRETLPDGTFNRIVNQAGYNTLEDYLAASCESGQLKTCIKNLSNYEISLGTTLPESIFDDNSYPFIGTDKCIPVLIFNK